MLVWRVKMSQGWPPSPHQSVEKPAAHTFKPSVTIVVLGAGNLDESAFQHLTTTGHNFSNIVLSLKTTPEQERDHSKADHKDHGP